MAKTTIIFRRSIPAFIAVLMHLILPAKILGDYAIYRTGVAGKLPKVSVPARLVRIGWQVRLAGSLLFLPALWVGSALALGQCHVARLAAIFVSGALTLVLYALLRRFNRAWLYVDSYDVGSARRLTGDCAVFQVFLGPKWRQQDRQRCLQAVRDACDWLESKAKEHGLSLRLATDPAAAYLLSRIPIPPGALRRPNRWRAYRPEEDQLCRHLETLRPQLAQAVRERLRRQARKPDQVCLIAHVPRSEIGFAMPVRNDLYVESELEICVCGRADTAALYAHELLHLFGAPDLYFNPWRVLTRRGEADEWTRRFQEHVAARGLQIFYAYFGNSIMGNTALRIERLTIDPITARAIGWRRPDRPFMKSIAQVERALGEIVEDAIEQM